MGLLATCRVELERLVVAREVIAGLVPLPPVAAAASAGGGVPAGENTEFGKQLLAILAAHSGPMRCREIVEAFGRGPAGGPARRTSAAPDEETSSLAATSSGPADGEAYRDRPRHR